MDYEIGNVEGYKRLIKQLDKYSRLCVPMSDLVNTIKKAKEFDQPDFEFRHADFENLKKNLPRILKECEKFEEVMREGMKVSQKTMETRIDF